MTSFIRTNRSLRPSFLSSLEQIMLSVLSRPVFSCRTPSILSVSRTCIQRSFATSKTCLKQPLPWQETNLQIFSSYPQSSNARRDWWLYTFGIAQALVVAPLGFAINGRFFGLPIASNLDLFLRCFFISWTSVFWTILLYFGCASAVCILQLVKDQNMIRKNYIQKIHFNPQTHMITLRTFLDQEYQFRVGEAKLESLSMNALRSSIFPHDLSFDNLNICRRQLFYHIFYFNSSFFEGIDEWVKIGNIESFPPGRSPVDIEFKGKKMQILVLKEPTKNGDAIFAVNRFEASLARFQDLSIGNSYISTYESDIFPSKIIDGELFIQPGVGPFITGYFDKEHALVVLGG